MNKTQRFVHYSYLALRVLNIVQKFFSIFLCNRSIMTAAVQSTIHGPINLHDEHEILNQLYLSRDAQFRLERIFSSQYC